MSHTIGTGITSYTGFALYQVTINNYTLGGEQFTPADFSATTIINVIMGNIPASANSLAVPLFPILEGGKVKLFRFTAGAPVEIATTSNLNATFSVLIGVN